MRIVTARDELVRLVEGGMEYPDAEWRVMDKYGLGQRERAAIREWYDSKDRDDESTEQDVCTSCGVQYTIAAGHGCVAES